MVHDKPASLLSYPSSANGTNNRSWVTNGSSGVLKAQWLIHNQLFWQYDMIMCMSITHFSGQESTCSHRWLPKYFTHLYWDLLKQTVWNAKYIYHWVISIYCYHMHLNIKIWQFNPYERQVSLLVSWWWREAPWDSCKVCFPSAWSRVVLGLSYSKYRTLNFMQPIARKCWALHSVTSPTCQLADSRLWPLRFTDTIHTSVTVWRKEGVNIWWNCRRVDK